MRVRCSLLLIALLAPATARAQDPDAAGRELRERIDVFGAQLQQTADSGLATLEAWAPGQPPGILADLARRVAALPLRAESLPRLAALISRDDPFAQEAGLIVARGQVEQGVMPAEAVEAAAAKAVRAADVDPSVVFAAVQLAEAAPRAHLEELFAALAEAASRGPRPITTGPAASRMYDPSLEAYARLDALLGARLGRAGKADAAILAHLEERHGTKGVDATRQAADLEAALARVHQALAQRDGRAAASALAQARTLAEGTSRAAEVERLAPLVGGQGR